MKSDALSQIRRLISRPTWSATIVVLLVILSRLLTREHSPLSWDASSFFLAANDYNIAEDRPHLPGYFLHVQSIRFFRLFLHPTLSNIAPSIFWSIIGSLLLLHLLRKKLDLERALLGTLLMCANPMLWFYGSVSESYAFDYAFSLIVISCISNARLLFFAVPALALGAGFRQSSAVLLSPLVLYALFNAWKVGQLRWRSLISSVVLALALLSAWLIPFLQTCGGLQAYLRLYSSNTPRAFVGVLPNAVTLLQYSLWACLCFVGIAVFHRRRSDQAEEPQAVRALSPMTLALWMVPALATFIITTYTKGYLLLVLGAAVLMLLSTLASMKPRWIVMWIAIEVGVFLFSPYYDPPMGLWTSGVRTESALTRAVQRTFSVFAMSWQHIRAQNQCLDASLDFTSRLDSSYKYIFVDPSYYVSARALQSSDSTYSFCMLDPENSDYLLEHRALSQVRRAGLESITDSAVIFTTFDVVRNQPLLSMPVMVKAQSCCCRFPHDPASRESLIRWYKQRFGSGSTTGH